MSMLRLLAAPAAAALLFTSLPADAIDPPQRVGRISYLEGTVSFHAADENDWSYATLNYPVTSGGSLWTEPNGRSEVQVGTVDIRMDHSTELNLVQLDEGATRVEVPQGVVNIQFSTLPAGGAVQVLTPVGPIDLSHPGTYHIDSGQSNEGAPSNQVQVTALEGQLEVRGPRSVLQVMQGETAVLTGNPPGFSLQEAASTPFDDWALEREHREAAHETARYVSPHMTGYEDLDNYGQWSNDPSYGAVWYPASVAVDWAPYRYGHWAYVAPWGWTWIDDMPWGFAPFHYGRWSHFGNRWGWVPGQIVERPVYAPALVAFIGGAGWSLSITASETAPAIGWVPLGPREVFHPYYPASINYVRNVNITNVNRTVINNITVNNGRNVNMANYANQRAATVIPAHVFQQGQAVHKALMPVQPQQLAHVPVTSSLEHIRPTGGAHPEGRPLPSGTPLPPAGIARNVQHTAESPSAPINHMIATPHAPQAPQPPVTQTVAPPREVPAPQAVQPPMAAHPAVPRPTETHTVVTAQAGDRVRANNEPMEHREHSHAPGPAFHRPATPQEQQQRVARFVPPAPEHQPLPQAPVPHPEQHAPITPTPHGWQRQAQPQQPQARPQPHLQQPGQPGQPGRHDDQRH